MDQKTFQKVSMWANFKELDKDLKVELETLMQDETALMDAFYQDIAFGTGGLRGILGVGTNRMNIYVVRKSTLGFLNYMMKKYPHIQTQGVAISYDCRKNSYLFAKHAAEVIASQGVKAYLYTSIRSTPQLSYTVRHLKCAGGIMITASHNPPMYNGYKIYDYEGCQLIPELADQVIEEINQIEDMFHIATKPFEQLVSEGMIELIDQVVDQSYLQAVKTVSVQPVEKNNIRIVYTPLHGTGATHMVNLLESSGYTVYPVTEQMVPDGNFSTLKSPNPEEASAFEYAIQLGKEKNADILIATDPDADRMGIAAKNAEGEYVLLTGNQTGAILLDYLGKFKKLDKQGVVFNTIVTSNLAKAICDKYQLKLVQTLTGFKYIGEQAAKLEGTNEAFFFGYEESYGYVIQDFVRDKDSFQATLLLAEVASYYKSQGKTLIQVLDDLFEEFGYYVEGVHNISLVGIEGSAKIEKIMRYFQNANLQNIAGKHIQVFEDYEQSIRISEGVTSSLTLPQSFVVKYIFDDGGWFVLRPSGTEPKLKIYIAIKADTKQEAETLVTTLKQEILQMIDSIEEV
ncbi:MAG: phospho-sugar mutase [Prevotella sp.]|nr:phospho-sugar mutase [Staphylococcus sp.]MCM1350789.1 phospho-sugar mutase [Prevotella sp.]